MDSIIDLNLFKKDYDTKYKSNSFIHSKSSICSDINLEWKRMPRFAINVKNNLLKHGSDEIKIVQIKVFCWQNHFIIHCSSFWLPTKIFFGPQNNASHHFHRCNHLLHRIQTWRKYNLCLHTQTHYSPVCILFR